MQRVQTLLKKLTDLSQQEKNTIIDIDLMLDYTRVLYADLLEVKQNMVTIPAPIVPNEPTLAEMTDELQKEIIESASEVGNMPEIIIPQIQQPVVTQVAANSHSAPAPSIPKREKRDIRHSIGINDKYFIISELFGNNKIAFEEVLDEINKQDSYRQALNWLDTHLPNHGSWDEENEAVELFQIVLSNFFANR